MLSYSHPIWNFLQLQFRVGAQFFFRMSTENFVQFLPNHLYNSVFGFSQMSLKFNWSSSFKSYLKFIIFGFKTTLIWFSKPTLTHTFTTIYAASQDNSVCLLGGQFWAPHLSLVKLHSSSDDGAWVRSFSHLFWSRGRQQDGFFMTPQNKKKAKATPHLIIIFQPSQFKRRS